MSKLPFYEKQTHKLQYLSSSKTEKKTSVPLELYSIQMSKKNSRINAKNCQGSTRCLLQLRPYKGWAGRYNEFSKLLWNKEWELCVTVGG